MTLWIACETSNAQDFFGLKAGVNSSRETFTTPYTSSFQIGFYAGAFGRYYFSTSLTLQADLYYSANGTKDVYSGEGGGSGHINTGNLDLPVLIRYKFIDGLYGETGPELSYLISLEDTFNGNTHDDRSNFHSVNPDWVFGAGYEFGGVVKGLSLDIRYIAGLTQINKATVMGGSTHSEVISAGLQFAFGAP